MKDEFLNNKIYKHVTCLRKMKNFNEKLKKIYVSIKTLLKVQDVIWTKKIMSRKIKEPFMK